MKKIAKYTGLAAIVVASLTFTGKKINDMRMENRFETLYNRTHLLYGDKDGDGEITREETKQFNRSVFSYGNVYINPENMSYREKIRKLEEYNDRKEQELKDAKKLKNNYEIEK